MSDDTLTFHRVRVNPSTTGSAPEHVMGSLIEELQRQAPDLLQRMRQNMPLPRPALKLIRTMVRCGSAAAEPDN